MNQNYNPNGVIPFYDFPYYYVDQNQQNQYNQLYYLMPYYFSIVFSRLL